MNSYDSGCFSPSPASSPIPSLAASTATLNSSVCSADIYENGSISGASSGRGGSTGLGTESSTSQGRGSRKSWHVSPNKVSYGVKFFIFRSASNRPGVWESGLELNWFYFWGSFTSHPDADEESERKQFRGSSGSLYRSIIELWGVHRSSVRGDPIPASFPLQIARQLRVVIVQLIRVAVPILMTPWHFSGGSAAVQRVCPYGVYSLPCRSFWPLIIGQFVSWTCVLFAFLSLWFNSIWKFKETNNFPSGGSHVQGDRSSKRRFKSIMGIC